MKKIMLFLLFCISFPLLSLAQTTYGIPGEGGDTTTPYPVWRAIPNGRQLTISNGGNVGIGTTEPRTTLDVIGTVRTRSLMVNLDGTAGADFVFAPEYPLLPLGEVKKFVTANRHLPDIPSAASMQKEGLDLSDFQIKLLQKIEELTLYLIEQDKTIDRLQKELDSLNSGR